MRIPGRITGWATLAVLLVAYKNPASAQQMGNKMSDVADQLRTELAGEPVTVRQQGSVTLTSGADAMFPSGGWELKPGVPVLSKIVLALSKLQHTEIVVGGYTDNTPIGPQLQSAGIANNLDLSCKRAANVVLYLVAQGVNPNLLSAQRHAPRWTERHARGTGEEPARGYHSHRGWQLSSDFTGALGGNGVPIGNAGATDPSVKGRTARLEGWMCSG